MTVDAVAVVVCCRDRADLLEAALTAVRATLRPSDELVVVDSASTDERVAAVASASGARVVRCAQPGLARARNAGWRSTDRGVVVFTDDDCRPRPGWLDAAVAALAEPDVGVVWGHVVEAAPGAAVSLSTSEPDAPSEGRLDADLSALGHGAAMAARREVLVELGGFDDELGVGARLESGEDKDLFWRAMRAGWRVRSAPGMVVGHVQWRGTAASLRQMFRYGVGAGAVASKRRRLAGDRGLVSGELRRHGLVPLGRSLRRLQPARAAAAVSRSAGLVAGVRRARRLEIVDGRFTH